MNLPQAPGSAPTSSALLLERRFNTMGRHSPLFYEAPLHMVRAEGVWMEDIYGVKYLDAYNNVPHVGHCNPRVVAAIHEQASRLNIHTRYLNNRIVEYSEKLLETFPRYLDRILYSNSGSEANELALRIARQRSGATGMIVTDFSYHGTTMALAGMTTGLNVKEARAENVRELTMPDLDSGLQNEHQALEATLAELDRHIESLQDGGYGVAALIFDPLFSTEGLLTLPSGLVEGMAERIHAAGGYVIADEVQSGFGRTGERMWGHDMFDIRPDFVTLGKPMGNGHPVAATVTTAEILEDFGASTMFFNTFAGNPVSAAAAEAVLDELQERSLPAAAEALGRRLKTRLHSMAGDFGFVRSVKGTGLYFGLDLAMDNLPQPGIAADVVAGMVKRRVLISRIGKNSNVLKIRPPMTFDTNHAEVLLDALYESLADIRL